MFTGASETWEKRGYWGNVLFQKALGHMPLGEHGTVPTLTPRQIRSRENDECVGGLRNPNRWVARTPSAQALRLFLRHFLKRSYNNGHEKSRGPTPSSSMVASLFSSQFVDSARHRLKVALQVKDGPAPRAHGYDADLIEALLRQSGDLETALPGWLWCRMVPMRCDFRAVL